ncbi:GNAT family N-acetyltransferase [Candidatus Parcubacteria bacterium]|jgi:predicted acetyltransferase|nr:GNAT family N-acetyltransferase [Candidatus Parcubacteria bacterium]
MLKLIKPTYKYRKSFLKSLDELEKGPAGIFDGDLARTNFKAYLTRVQNYENGINLAKGIVPASTFWLIDNDEFIGGVSFRHKLNKNLKEYGGHIGYSIRPSKRKKGYGTKMLALTLKRVKRFGLKKVMISCDHDNIASQKIIKGNGGILQEIVKTKLNPHNKPTMKWQIDL